MIETQPVYVSIFPQVPYEVFWYFVGAVALVLLAFWLAAVRR